MHAGTSDTSAARPLAVPLACGAQEVLVEEMAARSFADSPSARSKLLLDYLDVGEWKHALQRGVWAAQRGGAGALHPP